MAALVKSSFGKGMMWHQIFIKIQFLVLAGLLLVDDGLAHRAGVGGHHVAALSDHHAGGAPSQGV